MDLATTSRLDAGAIAPSSTIRYTSHMIRDREIEASGANTGNEAEHPSVDVATDAATRCFFGMGYMGSCWIVGAVSETQVCADLSPFSPISLHFLWRDKYEYRGIEAAGEADFGLGDVSWDGEIGKSVLGREVWDCGVCLRFFFLGWMPWTLWMLRMLFRRWVLCLEGFGGEVLLRWGRAEAVVREEMQDGMGMSWLRNWVVWWTLG